MQVVQTQAVVTDTMCAELPENLNLPLYTTEDLEVVVESQPDKVSFSGLVSSVRHKLWHKHLIVTCPAFARGGRK